MKNRLVRWSVRCSIFLLRGGGWAAIGVVVGFLISFSFRPVGRVDTFAFTETMLGIIITGLSVVGAFIIALQWSTLDKRMHEFDIKVKETTEFFDKQAKRMRKVAHKTDSYVQATIGDYTEKADAVYKHFTDELKIAAEINAKVEEYKVLYNETSSKLEELQLFYAAHDKGFAKRQEEFGKILQASSELIEQITALQPGARPASMEASTTTVSS